MTSLVALRQKLLTDPEVKAQYDRLGSDVTVEDAPSVPKGLTEDCLIDSEPASVAKAG